VVSASKGGATSPMRGSDRLSNFSSMVSLRSLKGIQLRLCGNVLNGSQCEWICRPYQT
jgi:hypothetical protein